MSTLKLKLKKIDPVKYGLITGATMALVILVIICIAFLFVSLFGLGLSDAIPGLGAAAIGGGLFSAILGIIFIIPIYFVIGFIVGWLSTVILNFMLKKTGGLEIDFEKSDSNINQIGIE